MLEIRIVDAGLDLEALDGLSRELRSELLNLDVDEVSQPPARQTPLGARGGEIAVTGLLLVQAAIESGLIAKIIEVVSSWRDRRDVAEVEIVIGSDRLTLRRSGREERQEIVRHFIASTSRH